MVKKPMTADTMDRVVSEHIRQRFREGATVTQIADELGVCDRTATRYLRVLGLRRYAPYVPDEELARMHADGMRPGEIAERVGLHRATVNNRLARMGLMGGAEAGRKRGGKTRAMAVAAKSRKKKGHGLAVDMSNDLPGVDLTKFACMTLEGDGPLTRRFNEQQRARWDAARKAKEANGAEVQPA